MSPLLWLATAPHLRQTLRLSQHRFIRYIRQNRHTDKGRDCAQRVFCACARLAVHWVGSNVIRYGEHMVWDRQTGQLARMEPFTNFFRVRTTDDVVDGGWGAWQAAVRYSHVDLTNVNIRGGISNEVTYRLIWYFNSHSTLIFNCITGTIRDHFPVDNQTAANFTILGTRLAVDF